MQGKHPKECLSPYSSLFIHARTFRIIPLCPHSLEVRTTPFIQRWPFFSEKRTTTTKMQRKWSKKIGNPPEKSLPNNSVNDEGTLQIDIALGSNSLRPRLLSPHFSAWQEARICAYLHTLLKFLERCFGFDLLWWVIKWAFSLALKVVLTFCQIHSGTLYDLLQS